MENTTLQKSEIPEWVTKLHLYNWCCEDDIQNYFQYELEHLYEAFARDTSTLEEEHKFGETPFLDMSVVHSWNSWSFIENVQVIMMAHIKMFAFESYAESDFFQHDDDGYITDQSWVDFEHDLSFDSYFWDHYMDDLKTIWTNYNFHFCDSDENVRNSPIRKVW